MAEKLKIISLGGLNEIGKNLTVYEYGNDIIVVDCGMGGFRLPQNRDIHKRMDGKSNLKKARWISLGVFFYGEKICC